MEITCHRCHQAIPDQSCFCPTCGLPQLVYEREESVAPGQADRWSEAIQDAGSVDWRHALRGTLLLGVPAGILSSIGTPVSFLCLLWMAAAAAWAVTLYVRREQPAWITIGAGARIGLVTGLMGGWTAFAVSGVWLFVMRYGMGAGAEIDQPWQSVVSQVTQQSQAAASDAQTAAMAKELTAWFLSPNGRAGCVLFGVVLLLCGLLLFSVAGGAIGARLLAKRIGARD
jgi:hypothetical protein